VLVFCRGKLSLCEFLMGILQKSESNGEQLEGEERLFVQILLSFLAFFFSLRGGEESESESVKKTQKVYYSCLLPHKDSWVCLKKKKKKKREKRRDIYYPFLSFFLKF
jgi:hypothetical protein